MSKTKDRLIEELSKRDCSFDDKDNWIDCPFDDVLNSVDVILKESYRDVLMDFFKYYIGWSLQPKQKEVVNKYINEKLKP